MSDLARILVDTARKDRRRLPGVGPDLTESARSSTGVERRSDDPHQR
jgi:hypothetical protein